MFYIWQKYLTLQLPCPYPFYCIYMRTCLVINKTNTEIYIIMCIFCKFTQFGVSSSAVCIILSGPTYFLTGAVSVSSFLLVTLIDTSFQQGVRSSILRIHTPSTRCLYGVCSFLFQFHLFQQYNWEKTPQVARFLIYLKKFLPLFCTFIL